ncbi:DUF4383 domain-containing protein [Amycolatopsis suaedae]|uniref:DUF4383 domain-containing protein n=1 Tax=Amycolatopsis suaedae TaxID=2510978 RepID=A0A4Q7JBZ0_9PSEU|nr:DUF4383 domain-containing protein [Amycolatopsis suaedae]RZQ63804.1 DUF4383 domain-containing protein [Amycolatopsis suaedae]
MMAQRHEPLNNTGSLSDRVPTAQLLAIGIGVVYLALGLAGFFLAEDGVGPDPTTTVLGFGVSTMLNVVHVVVGALGIVASRRGTAARFYGWALFVVMIALTVYGILNAASQTTANMLNLNWPDNWLHGVTAVLGLLMGFASRLRRRGR